MSEDAVSKMRDIMDRFAKIYTPEYLAELSLRSYIEDREYPENFSNWYPHILNFGKFSNAEVISNQILTHGQVEILQETDDINNVNWDKCAEVFKPTLDVMKPNVIYSIKNGCFSNKFDFETCVTDKRDFVEKMWKINYASSMFETGGYTEVVVRKYIPSDPSKYLTIYNGMPLRTEVRVFYNMITKKIEYIKDYWDYDYCVDNIHNLTDKVAFNYFHNKMAMSSDLVINLFRHEAELDKVKDFIIDNIETLRFDEELGKIEPIWSIDFMYDADTEDVYLIDMARGFRSAYWDVNLLSKETQEELQKR